MREPEPLALKIATTGVNSRPMLVCALLLWAMGIICSAPTAIAGTSYKATVIEITDGDTIKVRDEQGRERRIRLAEIDAPEDEQAHSRESKEYLSNLIFLHDVVVEVVLVDRYDREVALVYYQGKEVNAQLVEAGMTWVYRYYSDRPEMIALEDRARENRRGLWRDPEPVQPWGWRKNRSSSLKSAPPPKRIYLKCGEKRMCREMESCHEAIFYLHKCGLTRIDRDRDGIPCEQFCQEPRNPYR